MRQSGRFTVVLSALVALVAWMPPVSAATIGAEVFGAYNQYAMDDVNDFIGQANQGGSTFDELKGGITGGLGLRTWANPNWLFSATWEPLRNTTESGAATIDASANSFQLTGAYFFPSATKARYGIGAGAGYYSLSGEVSGSGDTDTDGTIDGTGFGFHAMGLAEWHTSSSFAITGSAGYRVADIEINDSSDGSTANYSGAMARVGFAFYMPTK